MVSKSRAAQAHKYLVEKGLLGEEEKKPYSEREGKSSTSLFVVISLRKEDIFRFARPQPAPDDEDDEEEEASARFSARGGRPLGGSKKTGPRRAGEQKYEEGFNLEYGTGKMHLLLSSRFWGKVGG